MLVPLIIVACGVLARHVLHAPTSVMSALDWCIIRLILPAVVIVNLSSLEFDHQHLIIVAIAWASMSTSAVAVLIGSKIWRWNRETTLCLLVMVPLANTSFFGLPVLRALLGETAIAPALVFDQVGSFIAVSTYGVVIAAMAQHSKLSPRSVAMRTLRFPPFLALVVALTLNVMNIELSGQLLDALKGMAAAMLFATMTSVGMRIDLPHRSHLSAPLLAGLGYRLGIAPLLVFVVARLLGQHSIHWEVAMLQCAMPPMISAGILARDAGLPAQLADRMVTYGLLLGSLTVPLWSLAW